MSGRSSGGERVTVGQPSPEAGETGVGGTLSPKSRPMGRKENIEAYGAQKGEPLFKSSHNILANRNRTPTTRSSFRWND
jgi:hypothetical protein